MADIPSVCLSCYSKGRKPVMAFVTFDPAPDAEQLENDWAGELPTLTGFVCTGCGAVLTAVTTPMFEQSGIGDGDGEQDRGGESPAGRFRLDDDHELE